MTSAAATVIPDSPLRKVSQSLHRYHRNDLVTADNDIRPVKDHMSTNIISIFPDKPAIRAGASMIAKKVKQLPVAENGSWRE